MKRWMQWLPAVSLIVALSGLANSLDVAKTGTLAGKVVVTKGKKNQNTVVYLKGIQRNYKLPQEAAVLDQVNKVFTPHMLAALKGQAVRFKNSDPLTHNVHLYWEKRSMFNKSQAANTHADWVAPRAGQYFILCNIHSEMSAALLVFDHPFFAVANGGFTMEDIPEGTYILVAVRDVSGKLREQEKEVTIKAGETTQVTIQY